MKTRFLPTLSAVVALLMPRLLCAGEQGTKSLGPPDPEHLTYESLRAWHKSGGLEENSVNGCMWPKEHLADLNKDGINEVFLGTMGWGRGMDYALFTKTKKGWVFLGSVDGSHHEIEILPARHGRWYDFRTYAPTGRGGLNVFTYTRKGGGYVQKSIRVMSRKELYGE